MDHVSQTSTSEGDGYYSRSVLNIREILSQPDSPPKKSSFIDLTLQKKKWETIVEKHKRDPLFNDYDTYTL